MVTTYTEELIGDDLVMKIGINETFYVDLDQKCIYRVDGVSKTLPRLPWQFLVCLVSQPEKTVTHEALCLELYDICDDSSKKRLRGLLSTIQNCFESIGLSNSEFKQIFQTQHGIGYIFRPKLETLEINPDVLDLTSRVKVPTQDFSAIVDCMLYQGISGKMGRHSMKKLAESGNAWSSFEIGELYYYGYCTVNHKPDYKVASYWYEKAAEKNHPCALWTLGYMIMNNYYPRVPDTHIDYEKALQYFLRAVRITEASGGFPAALTSIGQLWEEGHYPSSDFSVDADQTLKFEPRNINKAIDYYKQADSLGYHYATNRLALHYEKQCRFDEAYRYYKRSSELVADGYTFNKLGLFCEKGRGCEKDLELACKFYIRSVEDVFEDDITAWGMFNAGRVYANRIPYQSSRYFDLKHAFDLFCRAISCLPTEKHDQILREMMLVLLTEDLSSLTAEEISFLCFQTRLRTNMYLSEATNDESGRSFRNKLQIEQLFSEFKFRYPN